MRFGEENSFGVYKDKGLQLLKERNEHKAPGRKDYDGKLPSEPFKVINKCQSLAASVFINTSKAEKEYRQTVCKIIQQYSVEMVHSARLANSINIHDPRRRAAHENTLEYIEKINDMLPIISACRCISHSQEAEIGKQLGRLRYGYKKWMESDARRLEEEDE